MGLRLAVRDCGPDEVPRNRMLRTGGNGIDLCRVPPLGTVQEEAGDRSTYTNRGPDLVGFHGPGRGCTLLNSRT